MSEIMEQRSAIKFCVRNGISAAETLRMRQKAYGDGALSQARVFAWHRMFKEGRESVQDEPRAGRPSTSTDVIHVQKIRDLVLANRRLTVRDLTDLVGISEGSVKTILSDHLGLRKELLVTRADKDNITVVLESFEPDYVLASHITKNNTMPLNEFLIAENFILDSMYFTFNHRFYKQIFRRIEFNRFQKPNCSGRFFDFYSHRSLCHKREVIISAIDRILLLSNPKFHERNLIETVHMFLENDYPL
ncbi:SETMR methyltransferase, partial [Acromyrmex insinuator]